MGAGEQPTDRDEAAIRPIFTATLSADHRGTDGAARVRFLDDLVKGMLNSNMLLCWLSGRKSDLSGEGKRGNAKSILSVTMLGVRQGHVVRREAEGEPTEVALEALDEFITDNVGEGKG